MGRRKQKKILHASGLSCSNAPAVQLRFDRLRHSAANGDARAEGHVETWSEADAQAESVLMTELAVKTKDRLKGGQTICPVAPDVRRR